MLFRKMSGGNFYYVAVTKVVEEDVNKDDTKKFFRFTLSDGSSEVRSILRSKYEEFFASIEKGGCVIE